MSGYDSATQHYPVTYLLLGYTGRLSTWRNRTPYREPVPEQIDRMFAEGTAPPMIIVFVDAWTTYGGSQFVALGRPDVWDRWLRWDPVRMVPEHADALRGRPGIWIDAGTRDEWFLDLGATAFRQALGDHGVPDDIVHFELFDGGHHGVEYRMPLSLAWLAERLTA